MEEKPWILKEEWTESLTVGRDDDRYENPILCLDAAIEEGKAMLEYN